MSYLFHIALPLAGNLALCELMCVHARTRAHSHSHYLYQALLGLADVTDDLSGGGVTISWEEWQSIIILRRSLGHPCLPGTLAGPPSCWVSCQPLPLPSPTPPFISRSPSPRQRLLLWLITSSFLVSLFKEFIKVFSQKTVPSSQDKGC